MTLVDRGTRLAVGTLLIVCLVCFGSVALGVAALSGSMQTAWIILGGAAAFVAVAAVAFAMFRLWAITSIAAQLVTDIQTLITNDPMSERVVIDTIESSDGVQGQSAVVMSRQFFAMGDSAAVKAGQFVALSLALKAVTSFPLLLLLATVITIAMAGMSGLFLLGLIL